ncbi:MAG: hypothetical protein P8Z37_09535 [Acidobacteriota bacterium]
MAIIVVGGHARNVGKTSLVSAIIAAWPERCWTALKLTSHWHEEESAQDVSVTDGICRIQEESAPNSDTDSGRFLAAGASRAYWIRIKDGRMQQALPQLTALIEGAPNVIIESNGIVQYVHPDLFLMVVSSDIDDFKKSARSALSQADAIVAVGGDSSKVVHQQMNEISHRNIRVFHVPGSLHLSRELTDFIQRCFE